jgi:hypothetical protein
LEERLNALLPAVSVEEASLIRPFSRRKKQDRPADAIGHLQIVDRPPEYPLDTVDKNRASRRKSELLADIGLEDFAFVLLSEIITHSMTGKAGGVVGAFAGDAAPTVTNLALSSVETRGVPRHRG